MHNMKVMKKIFLFAALIAIATPVAAQAKTTVVGGPLTNLKATGQVIHLALSGFPTSAGFYIVECAQSSSTARPTLCNQATQLWVSAEQGATYAPNADIQFKPTATFTSGNTAVDCTKVTCGIFVRLDHNAQGNLSEDQFIPLTFVAEAGPTLPTDVITATINGTKLSAAAPLEVKYREVFTVAASAQSGVVVTYASLAPACAINGNEVTVLKGTGYCDIAVTSTGNAQFAGVTAHFPLKLSVGVQQVSLPESAKVGSKLTLPKESNFGEKISYSITKSANCSLHENHLTAKKKGSCVVKAIAPAQAETYGALKQSVTVKIK